MKNLLIIAALSMISFSSFASQCKVLDTESKQLNKILVSKGYEIVQDKNEADFQLGKASSNLEYKTRFTAVYTSEILLQEPTREINTAYFTAKTEQYRLLSGDDNTKMAEKALLEVAKKEISKCDELVITVPN